MEKVKSINSTYFRLFALGFVIILLAIIAIQIVLQQSIDRTIDPALINKSGRQRMISQRVSKLCLYIEFGIKPASPSNFSAIDSLKKYSARLQMVHEELIVRNNESVKNKEIESLLAASTPWVQTMVASSNELLKSANSKKNDSLLLKLAEAEMHFLPNMERVTKAFEVESVKELNSVRSLERKLSITLGVIIVVLFLILYFPILKKTEEQNLALTNVNKQLEFVSDKLSKERILLRTIIDNIPINIYVKDKEKLKTLVNRSEWEYLGGKNELEVLGKSDYDVYPNETASISAKEDDEVLRGNKILNLETTNIKNNGEKTWFLTSKIPLQNDDGEITGLVGVSIDISERKLISEELKKSLQQARELYDNAPCGYHLINTNGIVISMNQTELDWLGYTKEEVIGKMSVNQLITKDSVKEREQVMAKLKQVGHIEGLDSDFVRKDGTIMNVIINTKAEFDADGKMIANRSTVFDNTERKKLEMEIKEANERLIDLNEEKNSFMAMASHDLKNPLNSISGLISLMSHDQSISKDNRELIEMMNSTTTRMRELITRLLDYNKIEQGKTQINEQPVALIAFLNSRLLAFEQDAHKKKIQLHFEKATELTIHSDPDVLAQIFDNLISNAIKFSKANTSVTIRMGKMGNHIIIEVADQGPGIPTEELPRLFVPFTRLSARPTANESSTGLGLSIVKQLVQLLGGAISVESTVGKGSTFRVALKNE